MSDKKIAEVCFSMGRCYLSIAGITVAVEGDKCREIIPVDVSEPIPEHEIENAAIGGEPIKGTPKHIVQFFRGENWRKKSLQWAADRINAALAGEAENYKQSEAISNEVV